MTDKRKKTQFSTESSLEGLTSHRVLTIKPTFLSFVAHSAFWIVVPSASIHFQNFATHLRTIHPPTRVPMMRPGILPIASACSH